MGWGGVEPGAAATRCRGRPGRPRSNQSLKRLGRRRRAAVRARMGSLCRYAVRRRNRKRDGEDGAGARRGRSIDRVPARLRRLARRPHLRERRVGDGPGTDGVSLGPGRPARLAPERWCGRDGGTARHRGEGLESGAQGAGRLGPSCE